LRKNEKAKIICNRFYMVDYRRGGDTRHLVDADRVRVVGKVGNMIKKWWGKFLCLIGDHEWTGDALEGIPPSAEVMDLAGKDPLAGFKKFSAMYCKRCGRESDYSL